MASHRAELRTVRLHIGRGGQGTNSVVLFAPN